MGYNFPADLKVLVEQQMASGRYTSEDEVLRDALDALSADLDDLRAIEDALAELDAGDAGVPLTTAFSRIRKMHGIPSDE